MQHLWRTAWRRPQTDRRTGLVTVLGMTLHRALHFWRQKLSVHRKLIVVGVDLPYEAGHCFNELLGYKTAAHALGLDARIIVPRTSRPDVVASLSAEPVLEPV